MAEKSMEMRPVILEALAHAKDETHVVHPSRDELLAFLADVDGEAVKDTRTHVHGCARCQDQCYFLDPALNHEE